MLTTEKKVAQIWKPHPSCLGKRDGEKGYLPTEEYLSNADYQKAYFEGIRAHYLAQASAA